MSFIKKNVNIGLLLLIVIIILSLTVVTTRYQSTYQNLSKSYSTKLLEIEELTQTLAVRGTELNKTYTELQIRVADKARFDKLYSDLTAEKERVEAELASTREQLRNTQDDLATSQLKLEESQKKVNDLENKINRLQREIDDLKALCGEACQ